MSRFVVLLRGVNVGKGNKVPMAEFRELLSGLGYTGVATLLNSGNAVFRATRGTPAAHASDIAAALSKVLRVEVVQGIDKKVCSNDTSVTCATSADCTPPGTCGYLYRSRTVKIPSIDTTPRVWKLGDVVNSTPKISSWMALND